VASEPYAAGLRLLVVEDEGLVAMMLEDMLIDLGCEILGLAGSVREAMADVGAKAALADGAILDVNIGGEMVFPVAEALAERGVPFVFATGYGAGAVCERYPSAVVLAKPYSQSALETALRQFPRRVVTPMGGGA
jgi:CheY-like chemotaxis protein